MAITDRSLDMRVDLPSDEAQGQNHDLQRSRHKQLIITSVCERPPASVAHLAASLITYLYNKKQPHIRSVFLVGFEAELYPA